MSGRNWEPSAGLSALGPQTADALGWPGRGRGVLFLEKSRSFRHRGPDGTELRGGSSTFT